ncbi:MAG: hypothetical protein ACYDC8_14880 [Gammaproteobacteria bacterium]
MIAIVMFFGCSKSIDIETARKVADGRFLAYAKTLSIDTSTIPAPAVQNRAEDYVFTYTDAKSGKRITVIIGHNGGIADGYEIAR